MTIFPGDELVSDEGRTFKVERQVAYRGNPDCTSWQCTRFKSRQREDGTWDPGQCFGWHCSLCDAPTSMMGHDCARALPRQELTKEDR